MPIVGSTLVSLKMDQRQLFSLLQLTDSAFPIGGFSHSLGLEAYFQHHALSRKQMAPDVLLNALVCIIENSGSLSVPFVRAAYSAIVKGRTFVYSQAQGVSVATEAHTKHELIGQNKDNAEAEHPDKNFSNIIESLMQLDRLYEASSANHIAKRSSTRQGKSLLEASLHTFPTLEEQGMNKLIAKLPHCHHAVLHGAIMGCLGLPLEETVSSYMFGVARLLVATAVRLDVLGAMEGQRLQWKLQEICIDVLKRNKTRSVEQAAVKFPVLDVLQNTQDTLFAKLFYS